MTAPTLTLVPAARLAAASVAVLLRITLLRDATPAVSSERLLLQAMDSALLPQLGTQPKFSPIVGTCGEPLAAWSQTFTATALMSGSEGLYARLPVMRTAPPRKQVRGRPGGTRAGTGCGEGGGLYRSPPARRPRRWCWRGS